MTRSAVAVERRALLVERLDREFGAGSLACLAEGAARDIPWRLWRQALYSPLHEFLSRPGKEFRSELLTACWHVGGRRDVAPPELGLVIEALHAGSLIIDDIEDGSLERRGSPALHCVCDLPIALNAGNWLYFWPFRLLDEIDTSEQTRAAAHRLVTKVLLECHYGQALDLSVRLYDLEQSEVAGVVRAVTELKTGSLVGLAAGLGALVSGASTDLVSAAIRFGRELGTSLQMFDDLSGILDDRRREKGFEDLVLARPTWPWAWLSLSLDAPAYQGLLSDERSVASGAPPEHLARRLRTLVAPSGKKSVHAFLEQAFGRFAAAAPHPPALGAVRVELERLERSYV